MARFIVPASIYLAAAGDSGSDRVTLGLSGGCWISRGGLLIDQLWLAGGQENKDLVSISPIWSVV